jgi:hypothetical protein
MTDHAVDAVAHAVGADRRRAMLSLGAAGLATALAGSFNASARQSPGKVRTWLMEQRGEEMTRRALERLVRVQGDGA